MSSAAPCSDPPFSGLPPPRASTSTPPPVTHQTLDDLGQLPHRSTLSQHVTARRIGRHRAVGQTPFPLALRVQPDDALHPLADPTQGPLLRIVVVVPRIAQDEDRCPRVETAQLGVGAFAEGAPEVRLAVIIDGRLTERQLDRP